MTDKKSTLDYKDTAGYRLMKHEEFLKTMLKKKRRPTQGENTDRVSAHKN